jgi:hypothetical protein
MVMEAPEFVRLVSPTVEVVFFNFSVFIDIKSVYVVVVV